MFSAGNMCKYLIVIITIVQLQKACHNLLYNNNIAAKHYVAMVLKRGYSQTLLALGMKQTLKSAALRMTPKNTVAYAYCRSNFSSLLQVF